MYVVTHVDKKFPTFHKTEQSAVMAASTDSSIYRVGDYQTAKQIQNRLWNQITRHRDEISSLKMKRALQTITEQEKARLNFLLDIPTSSSPIDDKSVEAAKKHLNSYQELNSITELFDVPVSPIQSHYDMNSDPDLI